MRTREKITVLQSIDKNYIDENMEIMLKALGEDSDFKDNKWICNNASNKAALNHQITIYFNSIPEEYRNYVKYYVILSENKLNTKITDVLSIGAFLRYIKENENYLDMSDINQAVIGRYRRYLDGKYSVKTTKVKKLLP